MSKQTGYDKLMKASSKAIKLILESCINNGIENPKIEIDISVTDGSKYVLKFEKVSLPDGQPE
jgi:hypothetical protein